MERDIKVLVFCLCLCLRARLGLASDRQSPLALGDNSGIGYLASQIDLIENLARAKYSGIDKFNSNNQDAWTSKRYVLSGQM
jgi:hypothetical protein